MPIESLVIRTQYTRARKVLFLFFQKHSLLLVRFFSIWFHFFDIFSFNFMFIKKPTALRSRSIKLIFKVNCFSIRRFTSIRCRRRDRARKNKKRSDPWMTVVIPPLKGHFSWFLVSNIFCNPLFRLSTHHPFVAYPKTHFFHSLRRITFVFVCSLVCGRIFWTFIIRDGKNEISTSAFFSNTFHLCDA